MRQVPLAPAASLLFLVLTLIGCAQPPQSASHAHVPIPGYYCAIGAPGDNANATLELLANGSALEENWNWRWTSDDLKVRIAVFGSSREGKSTALASFSLSPPVPLGDRAPRSQVALTTRGDQGDNGFVFAIAKGPEQDGWQPGLHFEWADALALARGASQLFLIRHDLRTEGYDTRAIDSDLLLRAEQEIAAMRARLASLARAREEQCSFNEDLRPEIIVV